MTPAAAAAADSPDPPCSPPLRLLEDSPVTPEAPGGTVPAAAATAGAAPPADVGDVDVDVDDDAADADGDADFPLEDAANGVWKLYSSKIQ